MKSESVNTYRVCCPYCKYRHRVSWKTLQGEWENWREERGFDIKRYTRRICLPKPGKRVPSDFYTIFVSLRRLKLINLQQRPYSKTPYSFFKPLGKTYLTHTKTGRAQVPCFRSNQTGQQTTLLYGLYTRLPGSTRFPSMGATNTGNITHCFYHLLFSNKSFSSPHAAVLGSIWFINLTKSKRTGTKAKRTSRKSR